MDQRRLTAFLLPCLPDRRVCAPAPTSCRKNCAAVHQEQDSNLNYRFVLGSWWPDCCLLLTSVLPAFLGAAIRVNPDVCAAKEQNYSMAFGACASGTARKPRRPPPNPPPERLSA